MFILKEVKVVCFDILLQVLILKEMEAGLGTDCLLRRGNSALPLKHLEGYTPLPVFWGKRLQAIENKERRSEKEGQEISRGGKLLKERGLEEERTHGLARFV